jgi:N6-adenosine-specific RNA methylase IME4
MTKGVLKNHVPGGRMEDKGRLELPALDNGVAAAKVGLRVPGELTTIGWRIPEGLSFEEWEDLGRALTGVDKSLGWWIGDWVRYGEGRDEWGDKYRKAIAVTGKAYQTVANAKSVADAFSDFYRRRENLSWKHHAEVASLKAEAADSLLTLAETNGWSTRDLRKEVEKADRADRRSVRVGKLVQISKGNSELGTERRYPIIYADPPWRYEHAISDSRAIENHYPTMSLEEICSLSVADLATEDALLFLWATAPKLGECFEVLKAWDFDYRTCAVWAKDKIGMGYYFRSQHELLLLAKRGEPPTPKEGDRRSSIIHAARAEHSAKPVEFYELIEGMYPELPKIELFCRSPREGWAAWGNQAEVA